MKYPPYLFHWYLPIIPTKHIDSFLIGNHCMFTSPVKIEKNNNEMS